MILLVWVLVAVVLATVVVAALIIRFGEDKVRAITWQEGERWIRFHPNPGYRITETKQWSKFYGRGRQ